VAWSLNAVASGRQLYQGQPGTSAGVLYTSPAQTGNVTGSSGTAIIEEISLVNTTNAAATVSLFLGGSSAANALHAYNLTLQPYDSKIFSGLRTVIPASTSIEGSQGTSGAITVTISGSEVG